MQDNLNSGADLYKLETLADGIRNTGYRSIYNAIAELVDNSAEEDTAAKNIFIIGTEGAVNGKNRIVEYAVLDDGKGMNDDILSKCLQIGFSTRRERTGFGRFGVGLPQASYYASPRVEVYSWTNGIENAKCVYIDLDLVSTSQQSKICGPFSSTIPDRYSAFINFRTNDKNYDFSQHGTLVVWPKSDKIEPQRWSTCRRNLEEDLGRKYRWLLNDEKIEISTVEINDYGTFQHILPNDPLFLMKKSQYCVKETMSDSDAYCQKYDEATGYTEALFEPFCDADNPSGVVEKEVYYYDKNGERKTSIVTIRFSIVKEKYYSKNYISRDPGSLPYGKIAKRNMGISIVRQGREIDFGKFDYFDDNNQPFHRWWGCEISFTSELDEAFGISNNKQQVSLRAIDDESISDYENNEPMWLQLKSVVKNTITKMYSENQERRKGSRSGNNTTTTTTATSETIKRAEEENEEIAVPNTSETPTSFTPDIVEQIKIELTDEGFLTEVDELTDEQIKQYLDSNTRIKYEGRGPRSPFLDYEDILGVLRIYVNKDHQFYQQFVIEAITDESNKVVFELFLAALVKSLHKYEGDISEKIIDSLNVLLKSYLKSNE